MTIPIVADPSTLKAPLLEKVGRFVHLTTAERAALQDVQSDFLKVRAGGDIITAGHPYRCLFILNAGTAIRYKILHDGRRQILGVVLPGDFVGFPGCLFERALYSISSLGEAVVCPVSFAAIFELFRRHPRLGATLFWMAGHEAALFAEHLVGVGRQSAYERMARLLLELLVRLRAVGRADDRSYELPLTQELMADALGLSVPHVNRTLRRLREDGLIAIDGTRVTCRDIAGLSRLADFDGFDRAKYRIPGLEPAASRR